MLIVQSIHLLVIGSLLVPLFSYFNIRTQIVEMVFSILAVVSFIKLPEIGYDSVLYLAAFAGMYACILWQQQDKKIKIGWEYILFSGFISTVISFVVGMMIFKVLVAMKVIPFTLVYHTTFMIGSYAIPKAACIYSYAMIMRVFAQIFAAIAYNIPILIKNKNK